VSWWRFSVDGVFDSQFAAIVAARTPGEGVRACARLENAACAARLGHMADMLAAAQSADGSADREQWRLDNWAAVCAQIGAAHDVTSGVADGLLTDAVVLRERLPQVGAVFAAGTIGYRLVHQICQRTTLVTDPDALEVLDAVLAERVAGCGAMSKDQAEKTIDALVLALDPFAVCRTQTRSRGHHADVHVDDASGTAHVEAELSVTDGAAVDQRADKLAATVCERDPRTRDERRAAAFGAMGFGWDRVPCLCESPDCDAATKPPVGGIVIHMIGRQDSIEASPSGEGSAGGGPSDPTNPNEPRDKPDDGTAEDSPLDNAPADEDAAEGGGEDSDSDDATGSATEAESDSAAAQSDAGTDPDAQSVADPDAQSVAGAGAAPEPTPDAPPVGDLTSQRRGLVGPPPRLLPKRFNTYSWSALTALLNAEHGELCPAAPGVILGGAVVPAPVLAQAAMHATIRPLTHPGQALPEPRYRPSKALAEFIRCRDLTCRFPGCTRPATVTDVDHTIPYPWGPTAASNLACLCREHHLLKTFWPGWSNRQYSDGTIVWTDPDGQTHMTHPGSRLLFPELCQPTAEVVSRGSPPPKHTAGLTMPRRKATRTHDRAKRVHAERKRNTPHVAQHLREAPAPF
jgi:hypothetical protein